jgi:hypothetical protein
MFGKLSGGFHMTITSYLSIIKWLSDFQHQIEENISLENNRQYIQYLINTDLCVIIRAVILTRNLI